jgi:Ca2+-binding EF-hand superfamily protein
MDSYKAYDKELNDNRLFGMLDTKMNGKLDMSEMTGPIGKQFAEAFAKIDADHDGFIEPNELAAAQGAAMKRRQQAAQPQGQPPQAAPAQAAPEKSGGGQ